MSRPSFGLMCQLYAAIKDGRVNREDIIPLVNKKLTEKERNHRNFLRCLKKARLAAVEISDSRERVGAFCCIAEVSGDKGDIEKALRTASKYGGVLVDSRSKNLLVVVKAYVGSGNFDAARRVVNKIDQEPSTACEKEKCLARIAIAEATKNSNDFSDALTVLRGMRDWKNKQSALCPLTQAYAKAGDFAAIDSLFSEFNDYNFQDSLPALVSELVRIGNFDAARQKATEISAHDKRCSAFICIGEASGCDSDFELARQAAKTDHPYPCYSFVAIAEASKNPEDVELARQVVTKERWDLRCRLLVRIAKVSGRDEDIQLARQAAQKAESPYRCGGLCCIAVLTKKKEDLSFALEAVMVGENVHLLNVVWMYVEFGDFTNACKTAAKVQEDDKRCLVFVDVATALKELDCK